MPDEDDLLRARLAQRFVHDHGERAFGGATIALPPVIARRPDGMAVADERPGQMAAISERESGAVTDVADVDRGDCGSEVADDRDERVTGRQPTRQIHYHARGGRGV